MGTKVLIKAEAERILAELEAERPMTYLHYLEYMVLNTHLARTLPYCPISDGDYIHEHFSGEVLRRLPRGLWSHNTDIMWQMQILIEERGILDQHMKWQRPEEFSGYKPR